MSAERAPSGAPADAGPEPPLPSAGIGPPPFSTGLLLGVVAALAPAVLALPRVSGAGAPGGPALVVLWGSAALLLGPLGGAARLCRPLGGALTVLVSALFCIVPLSLLGQILKASTHHRPLGAVTFALVGALVMLGVLAVVARLLMLSRSDASGRARTVARTVVAIGSGVGISWGLVLVVRALGGEALVRGSIIDAGLLVLGVVAAAWLRVPRGVGRIARAAAPVVWVSLVGAALLIGRSSAVAAPVAARAPLLALLVGQN